MNYRFSVPVQGTFKKNKSPVKWRRDFMLSNCFFWCLDGTFMANPCLKRDPSKHGILPHNNLVIDSLLCPNKIRHQCDQSPLFSPQKTHYLRLQHEKHLRCWWKQIYFKKQWDFRIWVECQVNMFRLQLKECIELSCYTFLIPRKTLDILFWEPFLVKKALLLYKLLFVRRFDSPKYLETMLKLFFVSTSSYLTRQEITYWTSVQCQFSKAYCPSHLVFQNPPNTLWVGVWNPERPSQEVFVGPNTYSQGIWKTKAIEQYWNMIHLVRDNVESIRKKSTKELERRYVKFILVVMICMLARVMAGQTTPPKRGPPQKIRV